MVHHIVMWKFKPEVEDAKKPELKKAMAENLKSLVGKVPGLLTVDFVEAPLASSTHDMALVTTLEKAEDVAILLDAFSIIRRLERAGDHIKNIAEELIFYFDAIIVKHSKLKK